MAQYKKISTGTLINLLINYIKYHFSSYFNRAKTELLEKSLQRIKLSLIPKSALINSFFINLNLKKKENRNQNQIQFTKQQKI